MLKILDEQEVRTPKSIEEQYENCKYILINFDDIQNLRGNLYCVSTNRDSLHEMCVLADDLRNQKISCIIMGSYNDGSMPILHYQIQPETKLGVS